MLNRAFNLESSAFDTGRPYTYGDFVLPNQGLSGLVTGETEIKVKPFIRASEHVQWQPNLSEARFHLLAKEWRIETATMSLEHDVVLHPAEEKKIERLEQVEPWGAWQQLPLVKRLIKKEVEINPRLQFTLLNLLGVAGEMEDIRSGKASDDDVVFFRIEDFKKLAQRVHNHITAELLKTDETDKKLEFDDSTSILYFAGETITISKRAESDPHELLRTIFKDRAKVWNLDEVLDDWRFDTEKKTPKKKVYHAGKAVNNIIAQETKIKDFLDVNTKTVAINRKYLGS